MNKINLEIYDSTKTYLYPNMQSATPERVAAEFTAVNTPGVKAVITTDQSATMFYAIDILPAMAQRLGVDISTMTTDEEKLVAMEAVLNAPQPEPQPTAEERIAASMEYQNLLL